MASLADRPLGLAWFTDGAMVVVPPRSPSPSVGCYLADTKGAKRHVRRVVRPLVLSMCRRRWSSRHASNPLTTLTLLQVISASKQVSRGFQSNSSSNAIAFGVGYILYLPNIYLTLLAYQTAAKI